MKYFCPIKALTKYYKLIAYNIKVFELTGFLNHVVSEYLLKVVVYFKINLNKGCKSTSSQ